MEIEKGAIGGNRERSRERKRGEEERSRERGRNNYLS
jgi:hypothetical protein